MMKRIHRNSGFGKIAIVLCLFLTANPVYAQNEQERQRKDAEKYLIISQVDRQSVVVDKDLLDVYVRIMRYQTAWQDMFNKTNNNETTPDDYLTIAIQNVNTGNLKLLSSGKV
jgi:hypothetical protein